LAVFANNVTDVNYAVSNLSVLQTLGTAIKLYGEPRTVGVELRYQFGG
jgi:outer membrane receptor protein involved in Fe transport